MNAVVENIPSHQRAPVAAPHPTHVFKLLLKREFWENRGGFLWAPLITGLIVTVMTILGAITGSVFLRRAISSGEADFNELKLNVVDGHQGALGFAGDIALLSGVGMALAVMVFVVFFYSLGSLYDDRRDRSILFWKSMPVSDTQIVLSKALWALVLAPAVAVVIGLGIGMVQWLVSGASMAFNGIPGASAMFTESHPIRVFFQVLSNIPVYAFWALPSIGWLMLCSAWARSKPFLWAVLLPILACALISWLGTLPGIEISHDKVWYTIAFRGLLSIIPGTWYFNSAVGGGISDKLESGEDLAHAIDLSTSWQAFATADLWIGAVIGAAMIYGAIRLRRWRDEG